MNASEMRRFHRIEEGNRRLKQVVVDLTLDKIVLQEVLSKRG
jgi:putative transposase